PASRTEMALVGPIVKNELLLFTLTLAMGIGWMLLGSGRASSPSGPAPATSNREGSAPEATKAQIRLARPESPPKRTRQRGLAARGLLVVGLLAAAFASRARIPSAEPATALTPAAGAVAFDAGALADGRLHFFQAPVGDASVRFFAIRVGTEVHTNLDACEICGPIGYFLEGGSA